MADFAHRQKQLRMDENMLNDLMQLEGFHGRLDELADS